MRETNQTLDQACQPVAAYAPRAETPYLLFPIPAGFPSPAADHIEEALDLNAYLIRRKSSTFLFGVSGDSMMGAGILDGDKIVVDRSIEPRHGHIVVGVVNSDYTVKRLIKKAGAIELHSANPKFPPLLFNDGAELQIWGVVVGCVRRYSVNG